MDENKTNENFENTGAVDVAAATTDNAVEKKPENPNRITIFEIFVLILLVICIWLYISPNFLLKAENRKNAQIQTNASIFTSKVLAEFSSNPKAKATAISNKLIEELNAVNKNPFSKKAPAYCVLDKCEHEGSVKIIPNDAMNSINVEAYTKDDILLVRTVIQPPSFVTYTRDLTTLEKENKKKRK